ncbi:MULTISPECIES: ArsR/SmtB family transcription factor [Bacillota]|uniref:Arsenical resistance operon repressor n=2 Tax=Bacillota TaxID=1239 RepID=F2BY03_9FIRM|nr:MULTISPECIES: metalloregulator ArsR/SmtB family transcription factor [Bacillota]EGF12684.1 arsenical resistance operon repressor [Dialister micraerophilus DSM 19965]MDQ0262180.1 ArsR family transcriptional regulator [Streptococcus dysgalactiae]MDU5100580.1 metalloregulator ArsR/SmtB family transcription factor [Peptoniphilus grossensis]QQC54683.1 winged helix-turn-helix transcriptional regulator [Streptococcus dysgalactiae]SUN71397.1 arsenical resistance operon repressor [Streptococcus dysg
MNRDLVKTAKIFKAFSVAIRLEILDLLKNGEECACDLLEKLDLTQSGLSYHMKILIESGIVTAREDGKWVYYTISEQGRQKIIEMFIEATTRN